MGKLLGGALAGIFVGAVIMEVLHKTKPELLNSLGESLSNAARGVGDAFKEGYQTVEGGEPV